MKDWAAFTNLKKKKQTGPFHADANLYFIKDLHLFNKELFIEGHVEWPLRSIAVTWLRPDTRSQASRLRSMEVSFPSTISHLEKAPPFLASASIEGQIVLSKHNSWNLE